MSFKDLGLKDALVKSGIKEKGYTTPSPIQEKAIPHIFWQGKTYLLLPKQALGKQLVLLSLFFKTCQKQNILNTGL